MEKVSEVLAEINRHGVARPSRFRIHVYLPQSSTNGTDSLVNYFDEYEAVPTNGTYRVSLACENAEIPGRVLASSDQRHFGPTFKTPYNRIEEDIQLSFRCSQDMLERKFFEAWQSMIQDPFTHNFNYYKEYTANLDIIQVDETGFGRYGIRLIEAYPLTVPPLALDMSSSNSYHKQNVLFTYRRWEPLYFSNSNVPTSKIPSGLDIFKDIFRIF